ncbi:MAG TPA: hypothetical protein V6C97_18500 [Oculatellaceae cyanobacterium]
MRSNGLPLEKVNPSPAPHVGQASVYDCAKSIMWAAVGCELKSPALARIDMTVGKQKRRKGSLHTSQENMTRGQQEVDKFFQLLDFVGFHSQANVRGHEPEWVCDIRMRHQHRDSTCIEKPRSEMPNLPKE